MIEWNPEQAPQAIVMNSIGKIAIVVASNAISGLSVHIGYCDVKPPNITPIAPASSAAYRK